MNTKPRYARLDPNNLAQCRKLLLPHTIWLAREVFRVMPVLLPHLVRMSIEADQRGTPNDQMYAKDENTALKDIPGLTVRESESPNPLIAGYKNIGWSAAHILPARWFNKSPHWAEWLAEVGEPSQVPRGATNDAELFSFIPNVLWLPTAYSHYTDFPNRNNYEIEEMPVFNAYLWGFSRFLYEKHIDKANGHNDRVTWLFSRMEYLATHSGTDRGSWEYDKWAAFYQQDVARITFFSWERFFNWYSNKGKPYPPAIQYLLDETQRYVDVLQHQGDVVPSAEQNEKAGIRIGRFAEGIKTMCGTCDGRKIAKSQAENLVRYCDVSRKQFEVVRQQIAPESKRPL